MPEDSPKKNQEIEDQEKNASGVSRREFLKISGLSAAVPLVAGPKMVQAAGEDVAVHGPGKTPMSFSINGKKYSAQLEPRVTLLDALRDNFDLTEARLRPGRVRRLYGAAGQQTRVLVHGIGH